MEIHWDLVIAWIVNFLILIFAFRKLLWDKLLKEVEKRKLLLKKLKSADEEYKKMITFAHQESDLILQKAEKKKKKLIKEAELIAQEEREKIIEEADHQAEMIMSDAQQEAEKLQDKLKEAWVTSVKDTSKKVVKKLLKHNKELEDEYFSVLLEDLKKEY